MRRAIGELLAGRDNDYFRQPALTPDERARVVRLVNRPIAEPVVMAMTMGYQLVARTPLPGLVAYLALPRTTSRRKVTVFYDPLFDVSKWLAWAAAIMVDSGMPDDAYTSGDVAMLALDLGLPEERLDEPRESVMRLQPHVPEWVHDARRLGRRKLSGMRPRMAG